MSGWILGFDIGATTTTAVAGSAEGQILAQEERPSQALLGFPAMWNLICALGARLVDRYGAPDSCGVSIGGPLDSELGVVHAPPNLPGWEDIPLKRLLEERFRADTVVEHDAKAGALAEWMFGAARGARNVIFLTFGTGLGAGLILDGRLYRGANDGAGEVGHWRMDDVGPEAYGKAGSWEAFSSGAGLPRLAWHLYPQRNWGPGLTAEAIVAMARSGDVRAGNVVEVSARWLGRGIALLIDLLNPEVVVLGSLAVRAGNLFIPTARDVVQQECVSTNRAKCLIVAAELGEQLGAMQSICPVIYRHLGSGS